MKITGTGLNNISQTLNKPDSEKSLDKTTLGKSSEGIESTDRLDVSKHAQQMKQAKEIASDQSIDEAKVARLQKLIDEGKYNVDSAAIADRLVDEHLLMPES